MFPKFMCNEKNMIPASQQNTPDIEEFMLLVESGYYNNANYQGVSHGVISIFDKQ